MLNTYQFSFPLNKFPHSSTLNIITFSNTHAQREKGGEGGREGERGGKEPEQTVSGICRKIIQAAGVSLVWGSD